MLGNIAKAFVGYKLVRHLVNNNRRRTMVETPPVTTPTTPRTPF